MNNDFISVVIPTYNRKKILMRAIDSVFSQELQPIEIIIVDDNSSFDVLKFLQKNLNDSSLIKVMKNSSNLGSAKSRNIGVNNAQGDFISFLDSDDYWSEDKLRLQLNKIKKNKGIDLIYCDQYKDTMTNSNKKLIKNNLWNELISGWTAPNTSTLFFRKSSFIAIGGFDESLTSCQDHDLWMKIAKNNLKVEVVKKPMSFFANDASNRISLDYKKRMKGVHLFLEKWKDDIIKSSGKKKYTSFKKEYLFKTSFPFFLNYFKHFKLFSCLKVFFIYLFFNSVFYKKLFLKILK